MVAPGSAPPPSSSFSSSSPPYSPHVRASQSSWDGLENCAIGGTTAQRKKDWNYVRSQRSQVFGAAVLRWLREGQSSLEGRGFAAQSLTGQSSDPKLVEAHIPNTWLCAYVFESCHKNLDRKKQDKSFRQTVRLISTTPALPRTIANTPTPKT